MLLPGGHSYESRIWAGIDEFFGKGFLVVLSFVLAAQKEGGSVFTAGFGGGDVWGEVVVPFLLFGCGVLLALALALSVLSVLPLGNVVAAAEHSRRFDRLIMPVLVVAVVVSAVAFVGSVLVEPAGLEVPRAALVEVFGGVEEALPERVVSFDGSLRFSEGVLVWQQGIDVQGQWGIYWDVQ